MQGFLIPGTTLNHRENFHKDGPRFNKRAAARQKGQLTKKEATFNMLLHQNNFLTEKVDKNKRDRPWVVQK